MKTQILHPKALLLLLAFSFPMESFFSPPITCAKKGDKKKFKFTVPKGKKAVEPSHHWTSARFRTKTIAGFITGSPGAFTLEDYDIGFAAIADDPEWVAPHLVIDGIPLFVGIDLNQWVPNAIPFADGDLFSFVNGVSASLPGFIAGTSEITISANGMTTANPLTRSAEVAGAVDGSLPEPGVLSLLAIAVAGLLYQRRNGPRRTHAAAAR